MMNFEDPRKKQSQKNLNFHIRERSPKGQSDTMCCVNVRQWTPGQEKLDLQQQQQ